METKYIYLIIGFVLGWITKIPFLIKWYRDLKKTKEYKKMQDAEHYNIMVAKFKDMYGYDPTTKTSQKS